MSSQIATQQGGGRSQASDRELSIRPLTGCLGAKVSGVDLTLLNDATWGEIYRAWLDHHVLFFPGQAHLTPAEYLAFVSRFGEWDSEVSEASIVPVVPGHRQIKIIHSAGPRADRWHSDTTASHTPPKATAFRLMEAPPLGGDTIWASQYAAYESLSAPMRAFLDDLTAFHKSNYVEGQEAVHPVVLTNPENGLRHLFVHRLLTRHIVELSPSESRAILEEIFDWQEQVRFQVRWTWTQGDIAIWDNCGTIHYAVRDYLDTRIGHRIVVKGEGGFRVPSKWPPYDVDDRAFMNPVIVNGTFERHPTE